MTRRKLVVTALAIVAVVAVIVIMARPAGRSPANVQSAVCKPGSCSGGGSGGDGGNTHIPTLSGAPSSPHIPTLSGAPAPPSGPGNAPPGIPYRVTGADSSGLAILSGPHVSGHLGSVFVRYVPNGTTLDVVCQVNNGDQADGRTQYGRPFTTWDYLTDGYFVYDWYMTTPVVGTNGYSPGLPPCSAQNSHG